jgi:hypothetical protein
MRNTPKPILSWITVTTIFTSLALGAAPARADTTLAAEDLILGGGSLVIIVVLGILVIEWIFLPFAIFGTKDKLNQLVEATKKTNILLEEIIETVEPDLNLGDDFERR